VNYKDPIYENVEVGEKFGPTELVLDDFFLKSYAYSTDDYSGMRIGDGAIVPGDVVPGAAIVSELMLVFLLVYHPDKVVGLHQREEAEYFGIVRPGERLTLTGKYIAKYEKRGKGYVVLESEARDGSGKLVVRQRSTEVMRVPDGVRVGTGAATPERRITPRPLGAPAAARITRATAVGMPMKPLAKKVRQAQMSVFSGAEIHKQGIHTVRSIARSAGLKDCIAQGMMESCWASEFLTRAFGEAFLESGRHSTTYLSPVYPHDTIICEGIVTGIEATPEGDRIEAEYWLRNQVGTVTAVGWGSAVVGGD
jgi:acyl dehydratase